MSIVVAACLPGSALAHEPIRVMVVDDAVVVRGLITRWVEAESDMHVVASLGGGRDAIEQVERRSRRRHPRRHHARHRRHHRAAAPARKKRDLVVSWPRRSRAAMPRSACRRCRSAPQTISPSRKPAATSRPPSSFRRELIDKIRALGLRRKRGPTGRESAPSVAPAVPAPAHGRDRTSSAHPARPTRPALRRAPRIRKVLLRPFPMTTPRVLLIGSSTGGPQALNAILAAIGPVIDQVPVLSPSTCRRPSRPFSPSI